jgi:hypothetical protein
MSSPQKIDLTEVLRQFAMYRNPFGDTSVAIQQYSAASSSLMTLVMTCREVLEVWDALTIDEGAAYESLRKLMETIA